MIPLRILLSDGSGLTARQLATILDRSGHHVEVIASSRLALTRFTRHVRRTYILPPFGQDPLGWFDAVEKLLARSHVDVLLPTQEQVSVLALRARRVQRLGVRLPVPDFSALRMVQDKLAATETLRRIGLAQPATEIAAEPADALAYGGPFPVFLKAPTGTASATIRLVHDHAELRTGVDVLARAGAFDEGGLLVQAVVKGPLAMVQAVFQHGRLVASHANVRIVEGAGGGAAVKESIEHGRIRTDLIRLGETLAWNGALSLDAILTPDGPCYIDVNPRIVEPMNALAAGVDLVGCLLSVAFQKKTSAQPPGRAGVRTHQTLLALLGAASTGRRRDVLATVVDLARHRGEFTASTEELTPLAEDRLAMTPVAVVGMALMAYPACWRAFSSRAVFRYALTSEGWRSLLSQAEREHSTPTTQ